MFQRIDAVISDPLTWKGLARLLARLPMGMVSLTWLATLVSLSAAFLTLPFYYQWFHPQVDFWISRYLQIRPFWMVDTLPEAIFGAGFGVLLLFLALRLPKEIAWISGQSTLVNIGVNPGPGILPSSPLGKDALPARSPEEERPVLS